MRIDWTDASLLPALQNGSFSCRTHYIPGLINTFGPNFDAVVSPRLTDANYLGNDVWRNEYTVVVRTRATWNYALYPFDTQTFEYNFAFSRADHRFGSYGVTVVNSYRYWTALTTTAEQSDFLLSEEWSLPDDGLVTVWEIDQLAIRVKIERDPTVYMIKSMLLDVLVVVAGLAAMQLNPMLPPFFGARTGTLMTAMLMTINKSASRVARGRTSRHTGRTIRDACGLTTPAAPLRAGARRDLGFGRLGYM